MPVATDFGLFAEIRARVQCTNPACGHMTTTSVDNKKNNWINCSRCHTAIKIPDFASMIAHSASASVVNKARRED